MWDMNEITEIRYCGGYVYHITFDDGAQGDVDLEMYLSLGDVFKPLSDVETFMKARIEGGTIVWPNGADIAPETLYEMITSANKLAKRMP